MTDGGSYTGLRQRYNHAIAAGESSLRALLGSPSSSWKPIYNSNTANAGLNGQRKQSTDSSLSRSDEVASSSPAAVGSGIDGPVILHRKHAKSAPDVVRAICHFHVSDPAAVIESFRAILSSPEQRPVWDVTTDKQEVLELVDANVKILRAFTKVGWPSSPRDYVAINKVLEDPGRTLVDLSVSLPRASAGSHEADPPFLQPGPPFVRSHVHMCAWVITFPTPTRARLALYWQWNLRSRGGVWTNHVPAIPAIMSNLVDHVREHATSVPYVVGWGREVTVNDINYESGQDRLSISYGIFRESPGEDLDSGLIQLEKSKERRRLQRSIEVKLPLPEVCGSGWDVSVQCDSSGRSSDDGQNWSCVLERESCQDTPIPAAVRASHGQTSQVPCRGKLRFHHEVPDADYLAVKIVLQRMAGGKIVRVNGRIITTKSIEEKYPKSHAKPALALAAEATAAETVVAGSSGITTATGDSGSSISGPPVSPTTMAKQKLQQDSTEALSDFMKRTYTTFLALLQAPPAKWRATTDVRRVAVSAYQAIDTSATAIYRHEATFVNTSIWDIYSVCTNAGVRLIWDAASGLEGYDFLREVSMDADPSASAPMVEKTIKHDSAANEGATSFWRGRWKGVWPKAPRDAILARNAYKSPTSIHLFHASVPCNLDKIWRLISDVTPPQGNEVIRMQYGLQAIAIDQISPTTVSLTVLEQVDPKGWSRSTYSTTAAAVANLGEFVLKNGAPPVITRLVGATVTAQTYEHTPPASWRTTYEPDLTSRHAYRSEGQSTTECVIRCDVDVWSTSGIVLDVQPPPDRTAVLVRHRLSDRGPGCWITLEHHRSNASEVSQRFEDSQGDKHSSNISISITKGDSSAQPRDKHGVWINGEKIKVSVEELKEGEVKELKAKKRIRNRALMLDQPFETQQQTLHRSRSSLTLGKGELNGLAVARQSANASPAPPPTIAAMDSKAHLSEPMAYALEGLAWLQGLHAELFESEAFQGASDWSILSYAENNTPVRISKMNVPRLSTTQPIFRIEQTFPHATAEDVLPLLSDASFKSRSAWDDRYTNMQLLQSFVHGGSTSVWTSKPNFPLRSRIAYVATAMAHMLVPAPPSSRTGASTVYLLANVSFPGALLKKTEDDSKDANLNLDLTNPGRLQEANIFLEGWVVETVEVSLNEDTGDDEEAEPTTTHVKCSFFTCSDMPTSAAGAFGLGNARARLSALFDGLEKHIRAYQAGPCIRMPPYCMQVEGSLQQDGASGGGQWSISRQGPKTEIIRHDAEAIAVKLSLPSLPKELTDTKGQLNDSVDHPVAPPSLQRMSSTSSATSRSRAMSLPQPEDTVIVDFEVQREPSITGFSITTSVAVLGESAASLPISDRPDQWTAEPNLPLRIAVRPNSSPAAQAKRYRICLFLPTAQYIAPLDHPLASLTGRPALPSWLRRLSEKEAILHVRCSPIRPEMIVDGRPMSTLQFTFDGSAVSVLGEADAKRLGSASRSQVAQVKLTRNLPATESSAALLPAAFEHPVIVNAKFCKSAQPPEKVDMNRTAESAAAQNSEAQVQTQKRVPSEATLSNAVTSIEKAAQPIVDMFTAIEPDTNSKGVSTSNRRTFRLSFVLLVALISFLIGSLLRSLLSPNDYVFLTAPTSQVETALLDLLDPKRKWKYATRLVHVRLTGTGRDLIAAIVERD